MPPQGKGSYASIEVPPGIADDILGEENKKRIILTFDNGTRFHRALQRFKEGYSLITLGKATLKDAKKEAGLEETITLEYDHSEFGMAFPEEMQEVLEQDEEGNILFRNLKPGMQRNMLYYVSSSKTSETRIKRALEVVEKIKTGYFNKN